MFGLPRPHCSTLFPTIWSMVPTATTMFELFLRTQTTPHQDAYIAQSDPSYLLRIPFDDAVHATVAGSFYPEH